MQIKSTDFPTIHAALTYLADQGVGGRLEIPPGRHRVERQPPGTYNRFAAVSTHGKNIEIVGAGVDSTTIYADGDAGKSTYNILQFDPGAENITVRDLSIDTLGMFNTEEQTHAIQIGSGVYPPGHEAPVSNIRIERVRIHHGGIDGERKGDAIRVGGNTPASRVVNWKCIDVDIMSAGRSGFAMQRNSDFGLISHCYVDGDNIRHSMIDDEATGGQGSQGLRIVNCTLIRKNMAQSDNFAISLTSRSHFQVIGNTIIGKGISLVRGNRGHIVGNTIEGYDMNESSVIDIANEVRNVVIEGNVIFRAGPKHGQVIKIQPRNLHYCDGVTIQGNQLVSDTDGAVVWMQAVNDAIVQGNLICAPGAPASIGVYVEAAQRTVENLNVQGNTFRGCKYAAVRIVPQLKDGVLYNFAGGMIANNTGSGRVLVDRADLQPPSGGITIESLA